MEADILELVNTLQVTSMVGNFDLIQNLYEAELERSRILQEEINALYPDAMKWRAFMQACRDEEYR